MKPGRHLRSACQHIHSRLQKVSCILLDKYIKLIFFKKMIKESLVEKSFPRKVHHRSGKVFRGDCLDLNRFWKGWAGLLSSILILKREQGIIFRFSNVGIRSWAHSIRSTLHRGDIPWSWFPKQGHQTPTHRSKSKILYSLVLPGPAISTANASLSFV